MPHKCKSGPSGPRKPSEMAAGFSPGGHALDFSRTPFKPCRFASLLFPCHPEQTRRSAATERAVRDLHFSVACHGPLLLGLSELRRRLGKGTTAKPAVSETFWEGHDFSRATNAQIQYRL